MAASRLSIKLSFLLVALATSQLLWAGPRQQAYRLHVRLTGIPPSAEVLTQMTNLVSSGDAEAAGLIAIQNKAFYNLRLKQWFKSWSNVDSSNRVPFNDMVATSIGLVRDDIPFNQILFANILYIGEGMPQTIPPYAPANNLHYEELEKQQVDLQQFLSLKNQTQLNGINDAAGVITSRAFGAAYFSAGTNRRMTRYTFINFLCHDFESLHDITVPDFRIRRDVDRSPGGDSRVFKNKCAGCHAGQDALGGAWAYFDFVNGQVSHTPGMVRNKINQNVLFAEGHTVTDDSFMNLWASGQNSFLGFEGALVGNGARSYGTMLANSQAFARCMVARTYQLTCLRLPPPQQTEEWAEQYITDNYNMKNLIVRSAADCLGEE